MPDRAEGELGLDLHNWLEATCTFDGAHSTLVSSVTGKSAKGNR